MLSLLHIENIAVIETADIQFDGGFNVLTGETGAGKSIVIDAIGAITGGRTSRDLIRTGARSARVEAQFTGVADLPELSDLGVSPEGGELLLQREIQGDGKNICRLNGRLITVAQLRELGRSLINIHGQHDGQQLLDESCHLSYLDSFGETEGLLEDYRQSYNVLSDLRRQIATIQMDDAEKARRVDSLTYQIGELERANLQPGEEEVLTERRNLLRSAEKIMEGVRSAHFALSGDDDLPGASALAGEAYGALSPLASISPELSAAADRLAELSAAAEEAAELVRDLRETFDFEPG